MSTGFSFGAKTTAAPSFGTGSITFGTPASQPQQFGFAGLASTAPALFGTPTATTSALGFKPTGFGAPQAASTFGAPQTTSSFGTPQTTSSFGLATPASTTPFSGFSFGAATTSAPSSGFAFGAPTASTGLSFATPATSALSTGLAFKPPASSGLGFGGVTSTVPASTPALSFGATTSAAPGLSFGGATTASFSFGGLGGVATTTPALGASTTTQQNVGLGGVAFTLSKSGASSSAQKELPPKEQVLPNEFSQLVDQFKNFVQEEKNRSSDVARCSIKEFRKVESELDSLNHQLNQVENQLLNNRNLAEQLKYDTAKGLQNIEMAQRTQDTPPSLQYDNNAPLQFFLDLADSFEREMQQLKLKIDNTEKFIKKCNEPSVLTSQDLAVGLKRIHETFVALAGRMQALHSQVESQKEAFLHLRKQILKDSSNPFEKANKNIEALNVILKNTTKAPLNLATGPTPFNSIAVGSNNMTLAAQQAQPTPFQLPTTTNTGFGMSNASFGTTPSNTSLFKPTGFGSTPFQLNTSTNFQLQKPPTGNKRGKQ